MSGGEPKFLADSMLGKIARWLIILGYDASYAKKGEDDDLRLLERARKENRVFLTRDTRIPDVVGLRKIVIREQRFEDQLKRVIEEAGLKPASADFFKRCTLCNRALDPVRREDVLSELPKKVRGLDTDFHRCAACGRLYWTGTHVRNTIEKLRRSGILEK